MNLPTASLPKAPAAALWHLLWPVGAPAVRGFDDAALSVHVCAEELLRALRASPVAALAVHPDIPLAEVERLLLRARRIDWDGPWAADRAWIGRHRWLESAFGKALEIQSWDDFLRDPWPTVGRGRIDAKSTSALPDEYALNQLPGAMVVIENGALIQFNDAFSNLVGIARDGLLALPITEFWSDPSCARNFLLQMRSATSERELFAEANWSRGDQRAISVEMRCRVVGDATESRRRWIIAVNDVSRNRRALEYMQLQRELVERASSAIVILEKNDGDPHPKIRFANPCWEKISGFSMEETIGMDLSVLDKPGDVFNFSETLGAAIDRAESTSITVPCKRRTGPDFWADISLSPLDLAQDGVVRFVAIIKDATERVEAERHLSASERRFRLLFKDNRLPMFLHEEESGLIVDCNLAASNFCGSDRKKLVGLRFGELVSRNTESRRASGAPDYQTHRHADGTIRYVLVYGGDFQMEQGKAVRYRILVDCTAQHEAEDGLLEAIEAMQKANRAKSEFLQIVGHEIRTPMNAILGFSELLRDAETEEEQAEGLEMIEDGARNLLRVVESVVDYIDFGSDAKIEEFHPVDLGEFCDASVQAYATAAELAGLQFSATVLSECPRVALLPGRDYQKITAYVLDNAVKFTTEGSVEFTIGCDPASRTLTFTISDTGLGLSAEEVSLLFQPFSANDMSTERSHEGLGMGLALCEKLVKLYQGSITCKSYPGEGSVFVIRLPYQE